MASDSAEYFGLNLWDPTQPDVALSSGTDKSATTYGTRPFQGTKTAGRQPSTGATYDPTQIYNQGTNFTSQTSGSDQEVGEGNIYSGGFGNEQERRDCAERGGEWDDVRNECVEDTTVPSPSDREGRARACAELKRAEPGCWEWNNEGRGICESIPGCGSENEICPDPGEMEDPDNPGQCIPIPEECNKTPEDCIDTAVLNRTNCDCECPEDGEIYDPERGCITDTGKEEDGCTAPVPDPNDIASDTMKKHCKEIGGTLFSQCRKNADGTYSYKAECGGGGGKPEDNDKDNDKDEFQIPEDLKRLRWQLSNLLSSMATSTRNKKYPGQLTQDLPQGYADALASIDAAIAQLSGDLDVPKDTLRDLTKFDASDAIRDALAPLEGPLQRALSGVQDDTARTNLSDIARTGGMVETDEALASIREAAMLELDRMQAEEREKFGNLGLAAGSDISHALSQGASEGLAKMVRDQFMFQTDVDKLQAQNRVSASTALGNMDIAELSQLINAVQTAAQVYTAPTRAGMQSATIRHGAATSLGQMAQMQNATAMQRAAMQQGTAAAQQGLDTQNLNALYQEWQRQQQPSPYLNAALSYATGFPPQSPQKPIIQGGGGGGMDWGSMISLIAMMGMAPMSGGGSLFGTGMGSLFGAGTAASAAGILP
jgi:hypothetical protein